jgi:class 3 adenylate cyclase
LAPSDAARILVDAIGSYLRSGSSSLRSVSFAIPDPAVLQAFDAEFTRLRLRSLGENAGPRRSIEKAILFSDIVGSTSFFDRMGDECGMQLLDRYHQVVLPLFSAHRGDVVKSMGDGQLVVFPDVDPAGRCAQAMLRELAAHNSRADPGWVLRARLGIHFGVVISAAGDVFGDVVNSAQRIQSMAQPDQILLSDAARVRLGPAPELRPLGARQARGKSAPIEVFELPW